jgi:hypothetical protein
MAIGVFIKRCSLITGDTLLTDRNMLSLRLVISPSPYAEYLESVTEPRP